MSRTVLRPNHCYEKKPEEIHCTESFLKFRKPCRMKDAAFQTLFSFFSFGRDPHFQMLAVMVLSQHRVSTSKTDSPRIPVGARCMGHVRMMCSAVCSTAPHSQFDVEARPHLCMDD